MSRVARLHFMFSHGRSDEDSDAQSYLDRYRQARNGSLLVRDLIADVADAEITESQGYLVTAP
jgi:hypothetical protein